MELSLQVVQDLAPDQASLNAAKKLLKPANWPMMGQAKTVSSIWGQCQGSGANPYYVMADVADHGYKCTCPSRKFPCKHVLALLWQFANKPADFTAGEPPTWVHEWLGRRRKGSSVKAETPTSNPVKKNIQATEEDDTAVLSPEEQLKRDEAKAARAAKTKAVTDAALRSGLEDFQYWVDDQLRTGMGAMIKELTTRCRQVAARLVDAKATNLASRLDELPASVLSRPNELQALTLLRELGQLVLLTDAWLADSEDYDARRAITSAETRDQVLAHPETLRCNGTWENIGEKIVTRRDGLLSHTTWLLNVSETTPRFAMLQDYYPASAGKREVGLNVGGQLMGELAYYPSRAPCRAFLLEYKVAPEPTGESWPIPQTDLMSGWLQQQSQLPWQEYYPHLLNAGRIAKDNNGRYWWRSVTGAHALPLSNRNLPNLLLGCELEKAFVIWDGEYAELFSVQTAKWGVLSC